MLRVINSNKLLAVALGFQTDTDTGVISWAIDSFSVRREAATMSRPHKPFFPQKPSHKRTAHGCCLHQHEWGTIESNGIQQINDCSVPFWNCPGCLMAGQTEWHCMNGCMGEFHKAIHMHETAEALFHHCVASPMKVKSAGQ